MDITACNIVISKLSAEGLAMPKGIATEWTKTFEGHLAQLKAIKNEIESIANGRPCNGSETEVLEGADDVVASFKKDLKAANSHLKSCK
eukprot:2464059-Alexandrium_andersonii.AAC.1